MIRDTIWLLMELVILFFGVAFVMQLIQRWLGAERLRAWMGGRPVVAALKGIAVGFITPFCTYSAVPMFVGLRQAGVPPAGYVAFITAAPVLDPVLFGALTLIVGIEAAFVYLAIAFTAAMTIALIAQRSSIEHLLKPIPAIPVPAALLHETPPVSSRSAASVSARRETSLHTLAAQSCRGSTERETWGRLRNEIAAAARSAIALLRSVAVLLVIGVAIGLLIEAAMPPDVVASLTGHNSTFSIPVAAALGTPLYFNTGLFVPIAGALSSTGVGIGAIVALTISGSGANIPEFIILRKFAAGRLIAVFFTYVFTVAVAGGIVAQAFLG